MLYDLTSLQRDANGRGFSAKRTLQLAQQLSALGVRRPGSASTTHRAMYVPGQMRLETSQLISAMTPSVATTSESMPISR